MRGARAHPANGLSEEELGARIEAAPRGASAGRIESGCGPRASIHCATRVAAQAVKAGAGAPSPAEAISTLKYDSSSAVSKRARS